MTLPYAEPLTVISPADVVVPEPLRPPVTKEQIAEAGRRIAAAMQSVV